MQRFFNNVISPKYQKSQAQLSIELAERMSNVCQQVSIRSHRPKPVGPLMKFTQRSILYCFQTTLK